MVRCTVAMLVLRLTALCFKQVPRAFSVRMTTARIKARLTHVYFDSLTLEPTSPEVVVNNVETGFQTSLQLPRTPQQPTPPSGSEETLHRLQLATPQTSTVEPIWESPADEASPIGPVSLVEHEEDMVHTGASAETSSQLPRDEGLALKTPCNFATTVRWKWSVLCVTFSAERGADPDCHKEAHAISCISNNPTP